MIAALVLHLAPVAAHAAREAASPAACRTAEINPVTGHTFCLDLLGTQVEAAPDIWVPLCQDEAPQKEAGPSGPWTYGPNCKNKPAPG